MSKLERLRKSILDMSHDERMAMLHRVREDRKMSKAPIVKEKRQIESHSAFEKMVMAMTPEQRAELLAQLAEGEQDAGSGATD